MSLLKNPLQVKDAHYKALAHYYAAVVHDILAETFGKYMYTMMLKQPQSKRLVTKCYMYV